MHEHAVIDMSELFKTLEKQGLADGIGKPIEPGSATRMGTYGVRLICFRCKEVYVGAFANVSVQMAIPRIVVPSPSAVLPS
jgi:hypothetical protein